MTGTGGLNIMNQPISGASPNVALPDGMTINNTLIGLKDANGGILQPTDVIEVARLVNGQYVPTHVTSGNALTFIINSAIYSPLQNAVTAAYADQFPLFINNAITTTSLSVGGISVLPGSLINSNVIAANPTISMILSNATIDGLTINNATGTAIQLNAANCNNNILVNMHINSAAGYGILDNDAISDGLIVANSIINAAADAYECNHPTNGATNRLVIGNILESTVLGGSSGFALGMAQCDNFGFIGNIIKYAANTGIHIEDTSNYGIVLGNVVNGCQKEGFTIQVPASPKIKPTPLTMGFNSFKNTGDRTSSGIVTIGDSNGNVSQLAAMGNVVDSFSTGINVNDHQHGLYWGNIINNCALGVFAVKNGRGFGIQSLNNTTDLCQGQSGSIIDPIYSLTLPTHILTKSGGNLPGPLLRGWGYPVAIVHGGAGLQAFTIAPLPSLLYGDITCIMEGNGAAVGVVATIKWDGSTFTTVTTKLSILNTPITVFAITQSGSNLQATITSASTFTNTLRLEFEGYWMQNS